MPEKGASRLQGWDVIGWSTLIASAILIVVGLVQLQSNAEDVMQWLPDSSAERDEYSYFEKYFQSDDFLVVTWENCRGDDERYSRFLQYIRTEQKEHSLIQDVKSGPEVAAELAENLRLTPAQARARLAGFLYGVEDREQTCFVIELTVAGTHDRPAVIDQVWKCVDAIPNLARSEIVMGGYPYVSTYLDDQVNRSFAKLLIPSFFCATLISWICLRNLMLTLVLFVSSGLAAGLSLALVPLCGVKFGGLTSIIPTLAFVLTNSGGLHLIRYGLTCIGDPLKLIAIGWKPCLISTTTTAVGMLSLVRSEFPAIREFGLFCAAGVGLAFLFQMLVVPWLLWRIGGPGLQKMAIRSAETFWWVNFFVWIKYRARLIVLVSSVLFVLAIVGLVQLRAKVEVENLFAEDSEILRSLVRLEEQMGPLDQLELLLVFENSKSENLTQRLDFVRALQLDLEKNTRIALAHSLVNYLPSRPRPGESARAIAEQSLYEKGLANQYDRLSDSSFLRIDHGVEIWRMILRVPLTAEIDFGDLKRHVLKQAEAFENYYRKFDADIVFPKLRYTGKIYLFHVAQRKLLRDLFWNFMLAFAIITPLMILVLQSFSLGMIAMVPNVAPMLAVFGGMGFLGLPVDIAIAMTASVALGIAVDDTSHFLIRFREFGGRQDFLEPAINQTISQCGPAMLYTTVMGGAGIFVNYFSELSVVSRFAATLTLLLIVALLADIVMLPAILFACQNRSRKKRSNKNKQI